MFSFNNLPLQTKMGLLTMSGLVIGLGLFAFLALQSMNESSQTILDQRLDTARILADNFDENLRYTLAHLQNTASLNYVPSEQEFAAMTEPLREILTATGISTRAIVFINPSGIITLANPEHTDLAGTDWSQLTVVRKILETRQSAVSNLLTEPDGKGQVVLAIAPFLDDEDKVLGLLAALIEPASSFQTVSQMAQAGNTGYVEIIDGNGLVLARTEPGIPPTLLEMSDHPGRFSDLIKDNRAVVRTCHRCHEENQSMQRRRDILAFAPLSAAPWGVGIRQSESEALAPVRQLEIRFLLLGIGLIIGTSLLVTALTRSIIRPIKALRSAAQRVAAGDFDAAATLRRNDEIGELSRAFYSMTRELAKARDELISSNRELTTLNQGRGQILRDVIDAQEEERKRISRELHDESGQNLTAAIMKLESLESLAAIRQEPETQRKIQDVKSLMSQTLEDLRRLTLNLRPMALDDLGLSSAVRTYFNNRLEPLGIKVVFESKGMNGQRQLIPALETAIFRIVQEAVNNIAKHAVAHKAEIHLSLENDMIKLVIEDDGKGLESDAGLSAEQTRQPLGLLGIKERLALLGGVLMIDLQPRQGTRLLIEIPAAYATEPDGKRRDSKSY